MEKHNSQDAGSVSLRWCSAPLMEKSRSVQPEPPVAFDSGWRPATPFPMLPKSNETDEISDTEAHCRLSRLARAATFYYVFDGYAQPRTTS